MVAPRGADAELVRLAGGHRRLADPAGGLGHEGQPHHRDLGELLARGLVVDVDDRLQSLEEVERRLVLRVLTAMRGNRDETSRILGISRRTLTE